MSGWYGRRDEACPVSTGEGTRRVQSVREGGGGQTRGRGDDATTLSRNMLGAGAATHCHKATCCADAGQQQEQGAGQNLLMERHVGGVEVEVAQHRDAEVLVPSVVLRARPPSY